MQNPETSRLFSRVGEFMSDLATDPSLPQLTDGHAQTKDWSKATPLDRKNLFNSLMSAEHERIFALRRLESWFPEKKTDSPQKSNAIEQSHREFFREELKPLLELRAAGKMNQRQFMDAAAEAVEWKSLLQHYQSLGRPLLKIENNRAVNQPMELKDILVHLIIPRAMKTDASARPSSNK
jgi:hypothetical protein